MDPKWIVNLSGKDYPVYAGALAEAHERGLAGIAVELIQIPNQGNEFTAIVAATVTMKDGSIFRDYGDANPKNTNPRIATALIRMAATRAKGRALRDAVNIGETLAEEVPPEEPAIPAPRSAAHHTADPMGRGPAPVVLSRSGSTNLVYVDPETGRTHKRTELLAGCAKLETRMQGIGLHPLVHPDLLEMENEALMLLGRRMASLVKEAESFDRTEETIGDHEAPLLDVPKATVARPPTALAAGR